MKNCAFQFAVTTNRLPHKTKIICDESELTFDEARALYLKYKKYIINYLKLKDYYTIEVVLWIEMSDPHSYDKRQFHIHSDNCDTDGQLIWENKKEYLAI